MDEWKTREEKLVDRVLELEERLRWVPVSERLPGPSAGRVLSIDVSRRVHIDESANIPFLSLGDNADPGRITHWRDIGDLPGEEGK